ncbi:hypothetical protein [Phaeobacter inhibens]|uniref:hypothetical protein n=1 Tax=Phaeobacter inhibens TaxID=221822 RepID=UPI000C9ABCE0|nr:hypothetical protein [Phaeobacter inhibens]AUQ62219.1 putative protein SoxS [Phaeobacter inhibens]AUQ82169.1 putative protein SoxS [Phaeobacter inhibens]AUQ89930.1 putative protein SoxS [Phaeobacter inhibens]MDO6755299.1 hypothetical protein [Phaeobacter inhibens]
MAFTPLTSLLHRIRRAASALLAALALLATTGISAKTADAAELVMVEQPGCAWCARWDAEIAPIYPKTAEGRFAPLRRADLRAMPEDLTLSRRVTFTPTFLIVEGGHEMARLEGYPGEDFFWPLITGLLQEHAGFVPTGSSHSAPDQTTAPLATNG